MKFENLETFHDNVFVDIHCTETELREFWEVLDAIGFDMSFVAMPEDDGEFIAGCIDIEPKSAIKPTPDPNAIYFVVDDGLKEKVTKVPVKLKLVKEEST